MLFCVGSNNSNKRPFLLQRKWEYKTTMEMSTFQSTILLALFKITAKLIKIEPSDQIWRKEGLEGDCSQKGK